MESSQQTFQPGSIPAADGPTTHAARPAAIRDLLAAWRSAERLLEGTPHGGPEWGQLYGQVDRLRRSYQELFMQIRRGS